MYVGASILGRGMAGIRGQEGGGVTLEQLRELVRRERRGRRWSFQTVATKATELDHPIGASTVRSIENGSHAPTPESLRALAAVFGLDYYFLLRLAGYLPEEMAAGATAPLPAFWPEFVELDDEDREYVAVLVRRLARRKGHAARASG